MPYFYLRRALRSLRRTPALSSIMVVDMALGLALWILAYAAVSSHTRDPLQDSSALFHVDWGTAPDVDVSALESNQRALANAPHVLLSYADAKRLARHPALARSAMTFSARLMVSSANGPAETAARFCTRELFSMFDLAFEHGGPWDAAAERELSPVLVLDHATNQRLFGGENSVGRTLEIDGQAFAIKGVLAKMSARVRGYDFTFSSAPALYAPLPLFSMLGARPDYLAHRGQRGDETDALPGSDDAFVQLWVELPTAAARAQYTAFLRAEAAAQTPALQPRRAMLEPLSHWIERIVPIPNGFLLFEACAFLALLACSVNVSRLLLVKLHARAPELAMHRALGATRRSVLAQYMLEAMLVAMAATALALLIAWLSLFGINSIFPDRPAEFSLDASAFATGCAVGLGLGLLAGLPSAYRVLRTAPAALSRLQ